MRREFGNCCIISLKIKSESVHVRDIVHIKNKLFSLEKEESLNKSSLYRGNYKRKLLSKLKESLFVSRLDTNNSRMIRENVECLHRGDYV